MGNDYSNGTTGDTLESLEAEREDLTKTVACVRQMTRDFNTLAERRKSRDVKRIAFHLQLKGPHMNLCVRKGILSPEGFQWYKESMARKKVLGEQMLEDAAAYGQALVRWAEDLEKREKQQQQLALSPAPSVPVVTGGNALMPDEFAVSSLKAREDIWPTQQIVDDFLLGRGPNRYTFYNGDSWTEAMKLNPAVAAARYAIQQKLIADDKAGVWQDQGQCDYDLSHYYNTLGLLLDLAHHGSWWATNAYGGQNDWSVNGSFRGTWAANILTPNIAEVHFHLSDALTASSFTHISYSGSIRSILPNNPLGPDGPLRNVNIEWLWGWKVNYQLNGLYILQELKQ